MGIRTKIKSIRQNRDARTLVENFLSLSFLKLASYVFPLITLPYLARVIGVGSFGEIAFAMSIIAYFETLTDFGFNYTATRDTAKSRDDRERISAIFSSVMCSKTVLMLVSLVLFTVLLYSVPYLYERRLLFWMTFLYIPGHVMFPEWFFQGMEKMKYITLLNLLSKLLFTILVFVLIREKSDFWIQPLLNAVGYFISGSIALWVIFKKFGVGFRIVGMAEIWRTIRGSKDMFIIELLPNLYTNFSIMLLGSFGGSVPAGLFSSGNRFVDIFNQIGQVLSRTFYPFLARRIDKHSLFIRLSGAMSVILSLILFLSADLLVDIFYTEEFRESAKVIRILSVSLIFIFMSNAFGTNYLVLLGHERIVRNIRLFVSLCGFCLSFVLVFNFSYIGVAILMTTVRASMGILTWHFYRTFKKQNTR